jgi:hypothetical protein
MNKDIMRSAGFGKEMDAVLAGKCPFCQKIVAWYEFKD